MIKKIPVKNFVSKNSKMLNDYLNLRDTVKYIPRNNNIFTTYPLFNGNGGYLIEGSYPKMKAMDIIDDNALKTFIYSMDEIEDNGVFKLELGDDGLKYTSIFNGLDSTLVYFVYIDGTIMVLRPVEYSSSENLLISETRDLSVYRKDKNELVWQLLYGDILNIKLSFKFNIKYIYCKNVFLNSKINQLFINSKIVINDSKLQRNIILVDSNEVSISVFKNKWDEFSLDLSEMLSFFIDSTSISYNTDFESPVNYRPDNKSIPSYTLVDFTNLLYSPKDISMSEIIIQRRNSFTPLIMSLTRFISTMHCRYKDTNDEARAYISKEVRGFHLISRKVDGITNADDGKIEREMKFVQEMKIDDRTNLDRLKIYMNYLFSYRKSLSIFTSGDKLEDVNIITYNKSKTTRNELIVFLEDEYDNNERVRLFNSLNINSITGQVTVNYQFNGLNNISANPLITLKFKQSGTKILLSNLLNESIEVTLFGGEIITITPIDGQVIGNIDNISSSIIINLDQVIFLDEDTQLKLSYNLSHISYYLEINNLPVSVGHYYIKKNIDKEVDHSVALGKSQLNSLDLSLVNENTTYMPLSLFLNDDISISVIMEYDVGYYKIVISNNSLIYLEDGIYEMDVSVFKISSIDMPDPVGAWVELDDVEYSILNLKVIYNMIGAKFYFYSDSGLYFTRYRIISNSFYIPGTYRFKTFPIMKENGGGYSIGHDDALINGITIRDEYIYSIGQSKFASRISNRYYMDDVIYSKKLYFKKTSLLPIKKIKVTFPNWLASKRLKIKLKHSFNDSNVKLRKVDNTFELNIKSSVIIEGFNDWVEINIYYDYAFTDEKEYLLGLNSINLGLIE